MEMIIGASGKANPYAMTVPGEDESEKSPVTIPPRGRGLVTKG